MQERYLQAEQLLIDVRKDELLHRAVENTAKQMPGGAWIDMRNELERWIHMLATGDPATGVVALFPVAGTEPHGDSRHGGCRCRNGHPAR